LKDGLTGNDPALQDLEFPRVLDILKGFCSTEQGRLAIEQTKVFAQPADILAVQEQFLAVAKKLDQGTQINLAGGAIVHLPDFFSADAYLEPLQLLVLARNYEIIEDIRRFAGESPVLGKRVPDQPDLGDWRRKVAGSFEPDGSIREDATPELKRLHASARKAEKNAMAAIRREMGAHKDVLMDEVVTRRSGRLVIPVKRDFKGRLDCLIHDTSASGATVFAEPLAVVDLNNRVQRIRNDIWRAERNLLRALTETVSSHRSFFLELNQLIGWFDGLIARHRFSERFHCRLPEVVADGNTRLKGARHPLLLLGGQPVVPNDVELDQDRPVLVVSGSNTGGKTVFLKTVGLLQLMTQAAIPIPVDDGSTCRVVSRIMTDIGDRQSIEESLSTFSSHMMRLKSILESADVDTLVLVDELGTGTEPSEGAALAIAVTEALAASGCTAVITSHHYGLARLAEEADSRVRLAAVSFDEDRLVPTYHLRYDLPGASHAIEIATRIGLPEHITRRAAALALTSEEGKTARLSIQLARRLDELREKLAAVEKDRKQAAALRARLAEQEQALSRERRELEKTYAARFEQFLKDFRKKREQVFHGVSGHHRKAANRLETEFAEQFEQEFLASRSHEPSGPGSWREGQAARHDMTGMIGTITEVGRDRIRLRIRGKDLWVAPGDISPVDADRSAGGSSKVGASKPDGLPQAALECNLVGMRVDAALDKLEKELDGAMLRGLSTVRVIHGHGTGRLRKGIREYLRVSAYVSRFEPDTDDGATLVYLK